MTTARMLVTETDLLPYPDDDWTAIVKVYLVGDAIESWQVEAFVLHRRGQPSRRFSAANVEAPLPALARRLQAEVGIWLNANRARIAREETG